MDDTTVTYRPDGEPQISVTLDFTDVDIVFDALRMLDSAMMHSALAHPADDEEDARNNLMEINAVSRTLGEWDTIMSLLMPLHREWHIGAHARNEASATATTEENHPHG